jgi:hypothetical protein
MQKRSGSPIMDGLYPSKEAEDKRIVESWMLRTLREGGIERYDDLHIDRIDEAWRSPTMWIPAAFQARELALTVRDLHGFDVVVVLAFSLQSGELPRGVDFVTREDLESQVTGPPSLYLFRKGTEPWRGTADSAEDIVVRRVNPQVFGIAVQIKDCFYMEFRQPNFAEYSRSLFVAD